MSSIPEDIAVNTTLAFFTSRAQEYAALARQVLQFASGTAYAKSQQAAATANAATAAQSSAQSSDYMLELAVNGQVQQYLLFSVSVKASDGFAQRVAYSFPSRETTHHTMLGFYTENYGIGPGTLDMDVEVVFTDQVAQQIDNFLMLFQNAKPQNPLVVTNTNPVPDLILYDSYLGKTSYLSQTELGIEQNTEMLHRARIRISATIKAQTEKTRTQSGSVTPATANNYAGLLITDDANA